MKAWIDIDNPPQVQYLAPFVDAFARLGIDALVTARDYGITLDLLSERGIEHRVIGREFGASRVNKMRGTTGRALRLVATAGRAGRPAFLLSTSRSAAMAAWLMRIPSFMILDYEHAELSSFRTFRTTILHPSAIDAAVFRAKGFGASRLIAFDGIKEDISFAGRDIDGVAPHDFGLPADGLTLVLVRPPSETSHYFDAGSRDLTRGVLARLAGEPSVRVVFTPRHPDQIDQLGTHSWSNAPIIVERPIEFVSLLKAVDWVICAGGTMLREAAYLGIPAISIFRSKAGAVDRLLEKNGAVRFVECVEDLDSIDWVAAAPEPRIVRHPLILEEMARRLANESGVSTRIEDQVVRA